MNANELKERGSETAEQLQEKARGLKHTAREWSSAARTKAKDVSAAADLYVHQYTWGTLAAVAVAGGLIGYMLGRRE